MAVGSPLEFLNQFYNRPSKVNEAQKYFQSGSLPIHLKGRADISVYRIVMIGSALGMSLCAVTFARMTLGQLKRNK